MLSIDPSLMVCLEAVERDGEREVERSGERRVERGGGGNGEGRREGGRGVLFYFF